MKKLLLPIIAALAFFGAIAPQSVNADSREVFYYGQQLPSAWLNQMERDLRIAAGAWIQAAMGQNVNGFYANLNVTPVGGALNVQVGPNISGTVGAVFQFNVDDPNPIGGPGATALAADSTQIYIPGLVTSNSSAIGPVSVPSSGNTQVTLLEAQIQPAATGNTSINFVSQSGILTTGSGNEFQKDVVVYQLKAGTAASSGAVPPPADAGWIGIADITVPSGTTVITQGMINCIFGFNGFQIATQYPSYTQVTTASLIASANISAGTVTLTSGVTTGHCLEAGPGGVITDAGAACGTSTSITSVTAGTNITSSGGSTPTIATTATPVFTSITATAASNLSLNSSATSNGYVGINAGISNQPNGLRVFPGDGTSSTYGSLTSTQVSAGGSALGATGGNSNGPFTATGLLTGTGLTLSPTSANTIASASTTGAAFTFNNTGSTSGNLVAWQYGGALKAGLTSGGIGQFTGLGLTGTGANAITSATTGTAAAFQANATGGTTGDIMDWQVGGTTKASIGNAGQGTFVGVAAGGPITGATSIAASGAVSAASATLTGTLAAATVSTGGSTMTNSGYVTTATGANPGLTVGTAGNQSVAVKWNTNAADTNKTAILASGTTNCGSTISSVVPEVFCITGVGDTASLGGDHLGNVGFNGNVNFGQAVNVGGALAVLGATSTAGLTDIGNASISGNSVVSGTSQVGTCVAPTTGDMCIGRSGGTTGAIFFANGSNKYLFYDGTNFNFAGGGLIAQNISATGYSTGGTGTFGSVVTANVTNSGGESIAGGLTVGSNINGAASVIGGSFQFANGGGSGNTILSSVGGGAVAGISPTALYVYQPSYGEALAIDDGGNVGAAGNFFAASTRASKTQIAALDFDPLKAVAALNVLSWCHTYDAACKDGKAVKNVGPMADDASTSLHFVNGPTRDSLNVNNAVSIGLAAIQELNKKVASEAAQVGPTLQRLVSMVVSLKQDNDRLRARVASIEVDRARERAKAARARAHALAIKRLLRK